jgi:TolB-like protein
VTNQEVETPSVEPEDAAKRKKRKKDKVRSAWISFAGRIVAQIVGAAATVALGVTVLHQYKGTPTVPGRTSAPVMRSAGESMIAVLPMSDFSVDVRGDHFANGRTEVLTAGLAKVGGLRVMSRMSSMYFTGQRRALPDIADQLGVRWIVEGSIVREGNRVRIMAQLIDARSDQHAWVGTYDRPAVDLLGVQEEVASLISAGIAHELGEPAALATRSIEVAGRKPAFER